jgi:hypothetical protein
MGYRSDVAIAIYGPEDAMVPLIAAQRLSLQSALSLEENYIKRSEYTKNGVPHVMLYTHQDWVKWYDSFPEVQAWNKLLTEIAAKADETGLAYEFVRIGEETSDVEIEYGGDVEYFIEVHRSVNIALPYDETPKSREDNHDDSNAITAG